ncbi:hypothetical protein A6X20_02810 [Bradyrhizobium elkanii]|nr:hypothetical protein A6X20_02810 [Bradyrhizobium elkanii]ODM84109.1 hypothetical protein A6452_15080 [Bradyrhizobium elkanii]
MEILLVGSDGEVSGILCHTDARGVVAPRRRRGTSAIAGAAQFLVHKINNLLAVIDSGLLLLGGQATPHAQRPFLAKCRWRLHKTRCPAGPSTPSNHARSRSTGFVSGIRLATITGTLYWTLPPEITVRIDIAPDLWAFNAAGDRVQAIIRRRSALRL